MEVLGNLNQFESGPSAPALLFSGTVERVTLRRDRVHSKGTLSLEKVTRMIESPSKMERPKKDVYN